MSDRIDRRIRNERLLPLAVALTLLMIGAAGFVAWYRLAGVAQPAVPAAPAGGVSAPAPRAEEPAAITVFAPREGGLAAGRVPVKRQPDAQAQAQQAIEAVLADSRALQSPALVGMRLRACFLDGAGTAYVDLALVSPAGIRASARDELLALYALVNTLTQNVGEVRQVRFLVEGREAQTLAGHIDLTKTFTKRMDLVKQ